MKTPSLSLLVLAALFTAPGIFSSSAQTAAGVVVQDNEPPVVSLRGGGVAPELCPPNADCAGIQFALKRTGSGDHALTVRLAYGGAATPGIDYQLLPDTATFPAGEEWIALFTEPIDDTLAEGDETLEVRLLPSDPSAGDAYQIDAANGAVSATIRDNDAPAETVVSIEATSPIAEESSYPYRRLAFLGRFTISRTGPTKDAWSVFVRYRGTATSGVDYPLLPWLVTIPAGTNRIDIEVMPNPDDVPEPIEIVEATLAECPPLTYPPLGIPCYLVNIDPTRASARMFIRDDGITTSSLELTTPRTGAKFAEGAPIRIAATAIDLEGAITHVDFFDGDRLIGGSTINFFREPDPGTPVFHEFEWSGTTAGSHTLTARAVNAAGEKVTSAPVWIRVGDVVPVVSIEATVRETTEPSPQNHVPPGIFTLRRDSFIEEQLRVFLRYSGYPPRYGGTATPGIDYVTPPQWVDFPSGTSSVDVVIMPLDDDVADGSEFVVAEVIAPPTGPFLNYRPDPAQNRAEIRIFDSDLPTITFEGSAFEVREPTTNEGFTVLVPIKRIGNGPDLTVHIQITGTAANGSDYQEVTQELRYPYGASGIGFYVIPLPDILRENDETVIVKLVQPEGGNSGYQIDPLHDTAVITIHDSPPLPVPVVTIAATRPETTEPFFCRAEPCPLGPIAAPGTLTITRSAPLSQALEVYVGYQGMAKAGEDYLELPGVVVIPAGRESLELQVVAAGDDLVEGDETVAALLRPDPFYVLSPRYLVDPAHASAKVTIHDNTPPTIPIVSIRATQPITSEPCPVCRFAPGVFTISRTGSTNDPLHVLYRLNGTAKNGDDYEHLSGQAIIPAGRESVEVFVIGALDNVSEGNETVVARLYVPEFVIAIYPPPPPPYTIEPEHSAATVTIRDYPFTPPPVVLIVATDPFAREGVSASGGVNTATFTVTRSGHTNTPLAIHFTLSGTALPGVDYATVANPLIIPAGERRAQLVIKPMDDLRAEPTETVVVTLAGDDTTSESHTLGFPRRAAAIIVDKDRLRPPCVRLPDGLFNLCLPVDFGDCFRVEVTHDFKEWTSLGTVPVVEGHAHFVDADAPGITHRFYRFVPVPCEP